MKKVAYLLFLIIIVIGCASRKAADTTDAGTASQNAAGTTAEIQKITFISATRGYSKNIVMTADSIIISIRSMDPQNPVRQKLNAKEWSLLTTALSDVTLSEIPKLEAPSNLAQTDAAMGSGITISTSDGKQYAHHFDNTNPNEKLKKLMDTILTLEKSKG